MQRAGIILCGGRSTRMGRDKATLPFGRASVLERVLEAVSQTVNAGCVVVAGEEQTLPELPDDVIVVRDHRPGRGPLEGLAAGLEALHDRADLVVVASCDAPLLAPALVHRLFLLLGDHDAVVLDLAGIPQPLPGVYRVSILETANRLLEEDRLSLRGLLEAVDARRLDADEIRPADPMLDSFRPMNTPEAYADALRRAGLDPPAPPFSWRDSPGTAAGTLESRPESHSSEEIAPMSIEQNLAEMDLALPEAPKPVAAYVPAVRSGNLVFVSGQLPFAGKELLATGSVPDHVPLDVAQSAAKQCVLNGLAVLKAELGGDLSRLRRVVRIGVFVQSQDGFPGQPAVANGASEFLQALLGDAGKHARAAVGVNALPLNATVEIEFTFEVD